jgi:DNA-binding Lrp family transcriptional regulator
MSWIALDLPPSGNNARVAVTDDKLTEAYSRLGNVWKVADEVGISGQTVHRRLRRLGVDTSINRFTEAEAERIKRFYSEQIGGDFTLADLAAELGRTKHIICRHAGKAGLTKKNRPKSDAVKAAIGASTSAHIAANGHPRGMKGKRHLAETLKVISDHSNLNWATWKAFGTGPMAQEHRDKMSLCTSRRMALQPASSAYSNARSGRRADLGGLYVRSAWEANYARYLNVLVRMKVVESWAYEPETFWFEGIRRGVMSYKPDFRVMYRNDPTPEYIEIKGFTTDKDRTKWKRMKKYHPAIKLVVVGAKEYRLLAAKWKSAIPEWEDYRSASSRKGASE